MTEKRRRYLNSISYEEKVIRDLINRCKESISYDKQPMSFNIDKLKHKKSITKLKIIIKNLKKQLPAHIEQLEYDYGYFIYRCSVCKNTVSISNHYCPNCGKKLG